MLIDVEVRALTATDARASPTMQLEADTKVIPPRGADDPTAPAPAPAPSSAAEPLVLQRWVGRYELIHRIAHGGMATVYLGRAKGKAGFEKIVAVKVIHPHLADQDEFVRMFLDEARIAARIHHPHVVEILDLGEHEGVYYMVMEFIEGENLAALVRVLAGESLPVSVVLQIVADTLEGLGAAHGLCDADGQAYGLVHRDVSPHNILINLDGWAKVADFGILKAAGKASNTKTGELRGKLAYMSPEQARGDTRVDRRTDLFALGVVIWELVMGQRLFACPSEAATLEKVIACEVPPLSAERPGLDDELRVGLDRLLERALARDPDDRHASARDMLAEVKPLLRLASERDAEHREQGEPRAFLGAAMKRYFQRRVDYARAALRRTGEYDALVSAPGVREWQPDPTLALGRPPTGSNPSLDPVTPLARAGTGSHAGAVPAARPDTGTHASLSGPRSIAQWSLWLLLPMLGAAIAVVVMLWIGPRFADQGQPSNPDRTAQTEPPAETAPEPNPDARVAPSELAASRLAPRDERPPGTIRWYVTSTPSGAEVYIDGQLQAETTPVNVFVPIGEEPVQVRIELAGYESQEFALLPTNDQNLPQQLRALAKPKVTGPTKVSTKRKSPKPANEPKAGEADDKEFVGLPESLRE